MSAKKPRLQLKKTLISVAFSRIRGKGIRKCGAFESAAFFYVPLYERALSRAAMGAAGFDEGFE